jgi:hypothetical protein
LSGFIPVLGENGTCIAGFSAAIQRNAVIPREGGGWIHV